MCMACLALVSAPPGPITDVSSHCERPFRPIGRARRFQSDGPGAGEQIAAAFTDGFRYYMTLNILWNVNALFEGTQARNPRPDREEGLGAASRKGGAWHRCRRPYEGCGADPWRVLCSF